MVTVQRLYERLEELVIAADTAVEEFAASGDLTQLESDMITAGATAYALADSVRQIAGAISGSSSDLAEPSF